MKLEPGVQFLHYELVRPLGSGGAGEVFEAEDTRLGRRVAVKFIHPEVASQPEAIGRFRREARALASLDHPAIVTVHAIEELDDRLFLVMERVEGSTLNQLIPRRGLPAGRILDLALELTDAVAAAHGHGVVHRDLKPANVMVTPDGRTKVLDFGLARLVEPLSSQLPTPTADHLTRTGAALGTWHYMAPEQVKGEAADARSDVFALGVILYEMATGNRPFAGSSASEVAEAIFHHEPAALGQLRPDLPRSFTDIAHWCLEKDPAERPADARAVHDALAGLLRAAERDSEGAGRAGTGGPAAVSPRPPSRKQTRRRVMAASAAVLALLLLAAVTIYWARLPPPAPTAVAVLPFANLSGDPGKDHLARGIPAGLITRLGQVSDLQVLSRSESWDAADEDLPAERLAHDLGVASLVEGELHGDGGTLRVDVKLSDGPSGLVVWSDRFSGREEALFDLQRDIAATLVRVLAVPLSREERRRMARDPTSSLAAYSHHLRGELALEDATDPQGPEIAADRFREALRRDPSFALAHAGLAEALVRLHGKRADASLLQEADRHARRALELAPDLGPARVALARVARAQGHPEIAIEELRKVAPALARPDEAYRELAAAYKQMGDLEQAERSMRLAVKSGEESWFNWNALGALLLRAGRYDEARTTLQRAAELVPEGIQWPELNLATVELFQADWEAAVAAFERIEGPTHDADLLSNMATAYFYLGRLEEAEALYRRAVRLDPSHHELRRNLGDLLLRQGKDEAARQAFLKALELVDQRLEQTPGDTGLELYRALCAAKAGLCPEALGGARDLETELGPVGEGARTLAHVYALCGATDEALAALEAAIESGVSRQRLREEDEFEALRDDPRFQRLVASAATRP